MIPQRNLSLLSNRLAREGGRRIPEAILERDYCLAWFLVALSRTPLCERLACKGGTALERCYFGDYRFSEDLDFTLATEIPFEVIRQELEQVFSEARQLAGLVLRFVREDRHTHANCHTFFLGYEGPLPPTSSGKEVKVDVTIRERLVFPIEARPVLRGYEEYADLPEDAHIRSYSLGEIAAEKILAVTDPCRHRWRSCPGSMRFTEPSAAHFAKPVSSRSNMAWKMALRIRLAATLKTTPPSPASSARR